MRVRIFLPFLIMCFTLGSTGTFASPISYTFYGTQRPVPNDSGPSNFNGTNCDPTNAGVGLGSPPLPTCIYGEAILFQPFSATIAQTATPNQWMLTIQTNAPTNYSNGGPTINNFAFGDVLIQSGFDPQNPAQPIYWGIAIGSSQTSLNGSTVTNAGHLYKEKLSGNGNVASNYAGVYLTSGTFFSGGREAEPVWINPTNMKDTHPLDPTNALSITPTDCSTQAADKGDPNCGVGVHQHYDLYTITDTFNAPSDFLSSGVFGFEFSSFVCANGLIISGTPEPRAVSLVVLGILFLVSRVTRSRSKAQLS